MRILLIFLAVLYTIWPNDLLLDIPGVGWIDDLLVWALVWGISRALDRRQTAKARYDQRQRTAYESVHQSADDAGSTGQRDPGQRDNRTSSRREPPHQESNDPGDPHRVLGVEKGASSEEIRSAYRRMAGKYHPDRVAHLGDEFKELAENRFKEIQQAYRELTSRQ